MCVFIGEIREVGYETFPQPSFSLNVARSIFAAFKVEEMARR